MKRNLRFYFALMFARGTALVLKLIGRKGTSMPGSWAIILCPDFIGRMPKPKKIIGITGTNGKTTVSNMIEDVLEDNGIEFMCNRSGTNVATGVASTLIANSHFFGKPKCDLAVFELSFSGCSELTGLDAQALMSPPKTTADREAIYALMGGGVGDVTLVYPKCGDYRSAIISRDLDGCGTSEVVSFCANGDAGGTRLEFFKKNTDGVWNSMARFTSAATQVDKVFFGDLTGDGMDEIIVGWGDPLTATASVSVYYVDGDTIREFSMTTVSYSEMLLTDFDSDNIKELFVLQAAQTSGEEIMALGGLYRFDGDQPYVSKTVPLDAAVTRYTSVSFSQVNSWRRAAVLDGVKADGRMLTQVIGYDEASDRLISPLSNEENATDRPTAAAAVSRDVNKDGILEIPTAELTINGSETTADSTGYVITWNTYSLQDNTLTPVCTSILNTAENYNLFLPGSEDNYGCQNDTVTRTATFFTYTQIGFNGNYLGREDKFSIRVYTEEDWAEKEQDDEDILLSSSAGRVYVLRILDDSMAESEEKTLQSGFEVLE